MGWPHYRETVTAADVVVAGACLEGVVDWLARHAGTLAGKASEFPLETWVQSAAFADGCDGGCGGYDGYGGDGDGDGYGGGGGYGDGYGDGGGCGDGGCGDGGYGDGYGDGGGCGDGYGDGRSDRYRDDGGRY